MKCDHEGCEVADERLTHHRSVWVRKGHLRVDYFCPEHATPDATLISDEDSDLGRSTSKNQERGREYRALKNYLHNTLGVTRDAVKEIVKEAVREMTEDAVARYFETADFRQRISRNFDWLLKQKMLEIQQFCARELMKRYEVKVTEAVTQ